MLGVGRLAMAERKGIGLRRWVEYFVAVVLGNLIYYFSLVPHLPEELRHAEFRLDAGLAVDFLVCVAVYGLIRLAARIS